MTDSKRGFAAMDPEVVKEIARKGGKSAHAAGTAHRFTSEEAREAGRKGGRAMHAKRRGVARDTIPTPRAADLGDDHHVADPIEPQ
jgi:general stress protein YciG